MAIAIFNDQEILAGQKLGISTGKAWTLTFMAGGLAAMNVYHMGNAVSSKLLTTDSHFLSYVLLYVIALCIAFMEVPTTEEIVTREARGKSAKGYRIFLGVIVIMAMGAGVYSITSDADKRATSVQAHNTSESSYDDLLQALISDRNIARANATTTQERSQANADFYRAKAQLSKDKAKHQSQRPALAVKTDSIFHWLWAIGFSLLCSVGVVVITAYLTKYHKPLTEIPRVFFETKENQGWTMEDDDVRVIPATVDLAGGSSTTAARKVISSASKSESNKDSSGDIENHPAPVDSMPGAVSNTGNAASVRTLNDEDQKGGKVEYSEQHYELIKQGVLSDDIKPTQRPIKSKLVKLNVKFVTDAERQQKASDILERLKSEGVIIDNPEFGQSGKVVAKYIVNPDYSEQGSDGVDWEEILERLDRGEYVDPKEVGDMTDGTGRKPQGWIDYEQQQLEKALNSSSIENVNGGTIHRSGHIYSFMPDGFAKKEKMISSICPSCDNRSKVSESNLEAWGGKVSCPECQTNYWIERAKEGEQ